MEMPLRALSGMQHKCAGVQVGGDGLGTTSNGTVQHTHSTTSVHRRECFMSPRILSPTPHGPMDASMLSSSRPRLFQTCCICADAGCCRLPSDTRPSLSDPSVHRLLSTACMQIRACFSPSRLQRCVTPHVSAVRESSRKRSKPSVGPQWLSRISICWEALAISWLAALTHV